MRLGPFGTRRWRLSKRLWGLPYPYATQVLRLGELPAYLHERNGVAWKREGNPQLPLIRAFLFRRREFLQASLR